MCSKELQVKWDKVGNTSVFTILDPEWILVSELDNLISIAKQSIEKNISTAVSHSASVVFQTVGMTRVPLVDHICSFDEVRVSQTYPLEYQALV